MTLNQITTILASQLEKELNMPFKLMMAERVRVWRSRLIKNTLDKDQKERKFFRQTVYLNMHMVRMTPTCVGFLGCMVAESIEDAPIPLRANGIFYDYAGSVDGMNAFQEASAGTLVFMQSAKYSGGNVRYLWAGKKIQVVENPRLPQMRLDGVFDDPEAAAKLNCENAGMDCDFWNAEYPCTGDIMQLIIQSITQIDYGKPADTGSLEVPVTQEKPYAVNT